MVARPYERFLAQASWIDLCQGTLPTTGPAKRLTIKIQEPQLGSTRAQPTDLCLSSCPIVGSEVGGQTAAGGSTSGCDLRLLGRAATSGGGTPQRQAGGVRCAWAGERPANFLDDRIVCFKLPPRWLEATRSSTCLLSVGSSAFLPRFRDTIDARKTRAVVKAWQPRLLHIFAEAGS